MLLENSLYSTPAERDALVKDKKRVMDAMCFSFFGFLGCYQLAQNRSFLKTYQQSEGQLRLQSIGDNNHDVSLSIKLAEEAGAIPQAAAMNVTKLLYKIKSKQIRGPLDENLIRDVVKTLKISSHRPDTMVYSVVTQFEDGSIGLGELAKKLYNLSKIKQFQSVSGEFRQLVMKGQYQELFNKLPKTGTAPTVVAPSVTNTAAPKAVQAPSVAAAPAPAPAPVVVSRKLDLTEGFVGVTDNELKPLYRDMLTQQNWTPAVMRDNVIKFCKKNKITVDVQIPSVGIAATRSLLKFTKERFEAKDFTWMGEPSDQSPKWIADMDGSTDVGTIGRFAYLYAYVWNRHLIFEGKWKEYEMAMGRLYSKNFSTWRIFFIDDYNEEYINRILDPKLYWAVFDKLKGEFASNFNFIMTCIFRAGALGVRGFNRINFKMNPQIWAMLFNRYGISGYDTWKSMLADNWRNNVPEQAFITAFNLENSNVVVKSNGTKNVTVTAKDDYFKGNASLDLAFKSLIASGQVKTVDITDAFATLTKEALSLSKNISTHESFFVNLVAFSRDSFGNLTTVTSEKFIDWLVDQIISGTGITTRVFDGMPSPTYTDDIFCKFAWSVFVAYADKARSIPFMLWAKTFLWSYDCKDKINDPDAHKIMQELFEKNASRFDPSDVNLYMENLRSQGARIINVMIDAHKKGVWNMPPNLTVKAWTQIGLYGPSDVESIEGLWNFSDDMAVKIFNGPYVSNWRILMLHRYKPIREYYQTRWLNRYKPVIDKGSGWVEAFRSYLKEYYGRYLDEDMVKPDIKALVLDCIAHLNTARVDYGDLVAGGFKKLPDWMDKPVREELLKAARSNLSMNSISNIEKLEGNKALNTYINQGTIQEFADKVIINDTRAATQLSGLLDRIANNPTDYNVQALLRLAYTMHKNSKTMTAMGTTQTTKACYDSVCEALNSLMAAGRVDEVNQVYDALSFAPDLRTKIVDWFRKANQLKNALESVKADAIHALVDVDQKRMNQLMKYNNIKFPTLKRTKDTKLSDIVAAHNSFDLEPLAVSDENLDEKAMLRRTAEYDAFNKYRHGQIGIKFIRSFNVDIPSQKAANTVWNDAHPTAERMDPVFHGTGSVAAAFVLRYGFTIVSANDSSVVGRMLGNGIYFSNVLDKAAQYIGDQGYSRGKGTQGYLLQMKANLGQRDTDYKSQSSNLVSPEWCVFHPNDQLNIYKAHFVEIVDKSEIDRIKSEVNLNENFFKVEQFKQHLNEDLQNPVAKGCISYTFMDGRIPVSENLTVDFEEFEPTAYGPHVSMEPSGLGPVVYIEVDDPEVNEIYAVRYTVQFMNQTDDFQLFLNRLSGTEVK